MTMGVIAAVAEFERDLLIERTQAGLSRAKSEGKMLGRPQTLTKQQVGLLRQRIGAGESIAALAKELGTSRQTVMRARDAAGAVATLK
jgi:putative DNA-invertase from lambdoid prophage Rac